MKKEAEGFFKLIIINFSKTLYRVKLCICSQQEVFMTPWSSGSLESMKTALGLQNEAWSSKY